MCMIACRYICYVMWYYLFVQSCCDDDLQPLDCPLVGCDERWVYVWIDWVVGGWPENDTESKVIDLNKVGKPVGILNISSRFFLPF